MRNTRASQSPLYSEMETFIWAMKCMMNLRQFTVTFATDCSQLVKMILEQKECSAFASYLEDIKVLKRSFHSSKLIYVPQKQNSRENSLVRSARKQSFIVVHMDRSYQFDLQSLHDSVYVVDKKKHNVIHLYQSHLMLLKCNLSFI